MLDDGLMLSVDQWIQRGAKNVHGMVFNNQVLNSILPWIIFGRFPRLLLIL